jgi:hypothetical protein
MDAWLKNGPAWPKTPQAEVTLDANGVPRLTVKPDRSQEMQRFDCFYAVENRNPVNRFWRAVDSKQQGEGDTRTASLPVLDATKPLFAFANVHYKSGVCLSSTLVAVTPAKLGSAKATDAPSLLIDDMKRGMADWHTRSPGTDPNDQEVTSMKFEMGPDLKCGIGVARFNVLHTHKIGDPKWRGPDGARLQFEVYARADRKLTVSMMENEFAKGSKRFVTSVALKAADGWQTITLSPNDFKAGNNEALANWKKVQMLELDGGHEPGANLLYTNFRWAP